MILRLLLSTAGKTTIMGILTAEFPPTSGDATLAGFSVTTQPEQTRRRIGYCPQFDAHFTNMTGREHVELYAAIKGIPRDVIAEAAKSKLAEVGLGELDSDRLSSEYSGGMKRKLSVACATIGNPEVSNGMVVVHLFVENNTNTFITRRLYSWTNRALVSLPQH